MNQNTSKYQYAQLEEYKESLELAHLKIKTLIVNSLVFILAGVVLYLLIELDSGTSIILSTMTMFLILFIINIAFY